MVRNQRGNIWVFVHIVGYDCPNVIVVLVRNSDGL